jgi:hypothetical protein
MLRVDVTDAITLAELLEATRTAEAEALDNEAPFDELVRQMAHGGEGCSIFLLCQTALASIWEAGGLVGHLVAEALSGTRGSNRSLLSQFCYWAACICAAFGPSTLCRSQLVGLRTAPMFGSLFQNLSSLWTKQVKGLTHLQCTPYIPYPACSSTVYHTCHTPNMQI